MRRPFRMHASSGKSRRTEENNRGGEVTAKNCSTFHLFVYDVTRDGQRFLINTPVKQGETAPMSVVLNWTAKLNK